MHASRFGDDLSSSELVTGEKARLSHVHRLHPHDR
jgi:hypothetical protein